ncbi:NADH:ubiquinone reductase (Na(+)-transporting) subunit C [Ichthyobacterium seriolicida]|uniref:Na(+)-translocating NADH-quinone reductase subunit C n=1 Tax=Ichthyobacterium seriolicida TaxID=242600 RepID=A0A1J1E2V6_9FLAO|nr:NADH:ubiquinone reductase (Na(+)-transporting) subunit C [Ichthyobacterium seriolicida]BAV95277.1 Na(+)-translocating NADH-quinone reductase subunit C [Ichthyobacterium seriolicida]
MNTDTNSYTFIFSAVLAVAVAAILSFTALSLKDKQNENIVQEKMQNILSTIRIHKSREESGKVFDNYIREKVSINKFGKIIDGIDAFDVDLSKELYKDLDKQVFPLYIAQKDDKKYYIIPIRGAGLWNAIWGYVCLEDDLNTVYGINLDHQGETPGLGAEINKKWFQDRFIGKKIIDEKGDFVSVRVVKGGVKNLPVSEQSHVVDGISGGTITSDGVSNMIMERIKNYIPYFKKIRVSTS